MFGIEPRANLRLRSADKGFFLIDLLITFYGEQQLYLIINVAFTTTSSLVEFVGE